jgi:hypothetical protein
MRVYSDENVSRSRIGRSASEGYLRFLLFNANYCSYSRKCERPLRPRLLSAGTSKGVLDGVTMEEADGTSGEGC